MVVYYYKSDKIMAKKRSKFAIFSVIARLFSKRWTKWELIKIYNFNIQNYSVEVRQNVSDGRLQFRTKKIVYPAHNQYFEIEDVKKALANVL